MIAERPDALPTLRMTEDEFVAWCDEDVRAEFVDGEVILMSPVSDPHDRIFGFLHALLHCFLDFRRVGQIKGSEFQTRLRSGLRRTPDLLFVANAKLGLIRKNHFEGPPDAVFEIVSPDSVTRDYVDKLRDYAAAGIPEYWLLDERHQKVALYVLRNGDYELVEPRHGWLHSTVIEGFRIKAEWLWRAPLPDIFACLREIGVVPQTRAPGRRIRTRLRRP